MVTLHRTNGWKVCVYGREHGVPHFHIEGPDWRCSVMIESLEVIVGDPPKQVMAIVFAWAQGRQAELLAKWEELNP